MMRRMTGIDASFLYMETPHLPMHTLKLGILDLAGARGPFRFERVLETLRAHMHLLPRLRWRAVPVLKCANRWVRRCFPACLA